MCLNDLLKTGEIATLQDLECLKRGENFTN